MTVPPTLSQSLDPALVMYKVMLLITLLTRGIGHVFMEGYGRGGGEISAKINVYLTIVEAARMKNKMC